MKFNDSSVFSIQHSMIALFLFFGDWPDIVENRDIIEFHDIFDTKKEGLRMAEIRHFSFP